MQPTPVQVERSLQAIRSANPASAAPVLSEPVTPPPGGVPPEVVALLAGLPALRSERLDEVRERLASGDLPSDADLAERMVGRLVCDRLR